METKGKKIVCSIILGVVFLLLLIPTFYTILLTTKDYKPFLGLAGSEGIGLKNFTVLFSSPYFSNTLKNSIVIFLVSIITGSIYTFFASMSIGGIGNRWVKSIIAVLFAFVALIPSAMTRFFIPGTVLSSGSFYRFFVGATDGLRLAGLVCVAALFIHDDVMKNGFKATLLFVVLKVVTLFTSPLTEVLISYNPGIYEFADTLGTYTYRLGLIDSNFSLSATSGMVAMFIQLILAVPMIFIAKYIMKEENKVSPHHSLFALFNISAIVPFIIFIMAIILCGSLLPRGAFPYIAPYYANSFVVCLFSAVLVAGAAYGLTLLARNSGIFGVISVTVLCSLSANTISEYLLTRNFGMLDTLPAVIFSNFSYLPVITMLFMFATKDNRSVRKDIAVLVTMMFVLFALSWGDWYYASIYLSDRSKYTAALFIRQQCIHNSMPELNLGEDVAVINRAPMTTLFFLLMPALTFLIGSILTAVLNKSSKTTFSEPCSD